MLLAFVLFLVDVVFVVVDVAARMDCDNFENNVIRKMMMMILSRFQMECCGTKIMILTCVKV